MTPLFSFLILITSFSIWSKSSLINPVEPILNTRISSGETKDPVNFNLFYSNEKYNYNGKTFSEDSKHPWQVIHIQFSFFTLFFLNLEKRREYPLPQIHKDTKWLKPQKLTIYNCRQFEVNWWQSIPMFI